MTKLPTSVKNYRITAYKLPLAIFLEIAAHLRQIKGINATVILPEIEQDRQQLKFDYDRSQVKYLSIEQQSELDSNSLSRLDSILNYYARLDPTWQKESIE